MNKEKILAIREDFPELSIRVHDRDLIYLDNAASTLKCRPVIEAIHQHYQYEAANIHRGVHYLSEKGTEKYEKTRERARSFLNAQKSQEIIFTKGTTEAINLVAYSYGLENLKKGDEIVLSTMEHHSNIVPWQLVAQKTGASIVVCPITDTGEILIEDFQKCLTEKTKIVSLTHLSNGLGTINPIKEMIKLAHQVEAIFMVDGAQAIAHQSVDVQDLDCDFYAFSGHKMFGPTGTGVLYGKEHLLEHMPPYQGGGDMIDKVTFEKTSFNELPHKFEAGTPHIAGVIALKEAFDYLEKLGLDNIYNYENELLNYATSEIKKIEGIKLIGMAHKKASVLSFTLQGAHPHDMGTLLDRQGVAIRTGHHCNQPLMERMNVNATARASFSVYNTFQEVDHFIVALNKLKEFL